MLMLRLAARQCKTARSWRRAIADEIHHGDTEDTEKRRTARFARPTPVLRALPSASRSHATALLLAFAAAHHGLAQPFQGRTQLRILDIGETVVKPAALVAVERPRPGRLPRCGSQRRRLAQREPGHPAIAEEGVYAP